MLGFIPLAGFPGRPSSASSVTQRRGRYCRHVRAVVAARGDAGPPVPASEGVRINKCFKSRYSRRESDALIDSGRVAVNGRPVSPGARVRPGDVVTLDGDEVEWERLALGGTVEEFAYIKLHKPVGVVTTSSDEVENNIISCLRNSGYDGQDRVFFVGRLDEQTSGLILGTSDGSLVNAALGGSSTSVKEYVVVTDRRVSDEDMETLRRGVVIKTVAQYARGRPALVAPTLPCIVERVVPEDADDRQLRISLREGRNRQIRKMLVRAAQCPASR